MQTTVRSSLLRNFCPRCLTFFVNRPVADCQRDLLSLENTELPCLVEWQLLLDAVLSDNDCSLLPAKDFPLFTAFKSLFLDSSANSSPRYPVKLDDFGFCPHVFCVYLILRPAYAKARLPGQP